MDTHGDGAGLIEPRLDSAAEATAETCEHVQVMAKGHAILQRARQLSRNLEMRLSALTEHFRA